MLREILRKMSKDDSSLQLKSLEQVLQLGHSIAQQDSQERLNEARLLQGQEKRRVGAGNGRTPSHRRPAAAVAVSGGSAGIASSSFTAHSHRSSNGSGNGGGGGSSSSGSRGQNSLNSSMVDETSDLDTSFPPSTLPSRSNTSAASRQQVFTPKPAQSNPNGSISRLAKVPGLTPDPSVKKVKKVFGHAVK